MQADPARFAYMVVEHADLHRVLSFASGVRRRSSTASILLCFNGPLSRTDRAQVAAAGIVPVGSGARVQRGDASLLDRTMAALQQALEVEWDWLAFLSGQDYPTGDLRTWEQFVTTSGVDAVNAADPVRGDDLEHVQRYAFRWWLLRTAGSPPRLVDRVLLRLVREAARRSSCVAHRSSDADEWIGLRRRGGRMPDLWKGDFWTAMSRRAARGVLDEHRTGTLRRRLHRTMFPEEVFLPTVLRRLPVTVLSRPVTLTTWPTDGSSHPLELRMDDLPLLLATDSPFARKFGGPDREPLLQALDACFDASRTAGATPRGCEGPDRRSET